VSSAALSFPGGGKKPRRFLRLGFKFIGNDTQTYVT
jgi:hypothetical protein